MYLQPECVDFRKLVEFSTFLKLCLRMYVFPHSAVTFQTLAMQKE